MHLTFCLIKDKFLIGHYTVIYLYIKTSQKNNPNGNYHLQKNLKKKKKNLTKGQSIIPSLYSQMYLINEDSAVAMERSHCARKHESGQIYVLWVVVRRGRAEGCYIVKLVA